jgi:hypothetical protein
MTWSDVWKRLGVSVSQPVPRHPEIKEPLAKHIIKLLQNIRGSPRNQCLQESHKPGNGCAAETIKR